MDKTSVRSPVSDSSTSGGIFPDGTSEIQSRNLDGTSDPFLKPPGTMPGTVKKGPGPAETGRLKKPRSRNPSTSSSISNIAQVIKGPFICTSNLKIHLAIRASSTETAAPALP